MCEKYKRGVCVNLNMKLAESCVKFIKNEIKDFSPSVGLVLGSGLGEILDNAEIVASIDYSSIPNFPVSTVSGHKGKFLFFRYNNKNVVAMQGRVHFYEGYGMEKAVLPICVMKLLGVEVLMLTNASGGVNPNFNAGDVMVITDHISSFIPSPLIGENDDIYGERFPDMSNVYNKDLCKIIFDVAKKNNIELKSGVYLQATGPNYETPAEVKMFSILGADAVGMSTVCEAITAHYLGIKVCGMSLVTNKAVGLRAEPLSHIEVQQIAQNSADKIYTVLKGFIESLC